MRAWFDSVEIGGNPKSSVQRQFDITPIVDYAISNEMYEHDPEEVYKAWVGEDTLDSESQPRRNSWRCDGHRTSPG